MAKHFHPEILFSREDGCLLPRKGAIPSDNWREISQKMIGIEGFGYRREFEQLCALLLRCREPKEMPALDKCFGGYAYSWNWLRHDDDTTTLHNNENCNCLRASSPFKGGREKSRASGTRKETWEQCAGKESESSLARSLATRNGEVAPSP